MTKEEAIKIIEDARAVVLCNGEYDKAMSMAIEALKAEPKHGRWIATEKGAKVTAYKCSECGRVVWDDTGYDVSEDYPYCHCGAKMFGKDTDVPDKNVGKMDEVTEKEKIKVEERYNPCLTCSQIGNTFCDCSKR